EEVSENSTTGANASAGQYVYLEVADSGHGMDEETKSRIFDPFFTTKFTGRGLGLAAVSGIVRGHNGAMTVETRMGHGTTFRIMFPALERSAPKKTAGFEAMELRGSGTVLVVEDEPVVARIAKAALEHYGYTVLTAENGKEAVEIFERSHERIAAVLLDLIMPVMSGEEALEQFRKIDPNVPVVITSGHRELAANHRVQEVGAAGHLQKPYTAPQLARTIKTAMKK
ncbi:MAG: response regulator, partial [Acidobacteriota bacterium]|nr:response regulator [Acidobacteriota bacterium]